MITPRTPLGDRAHLEEGDLVRILDGELRPGNGSGPEAHRRSCAECREALDRIALRAARLSHALTLVDPSTPVVRIFDTPDSPSGTRSFRSIRWLRAAALAALVITAAALGSTTVRAWMVSGWSAVRAAVPGLGSPGEPVSSPAASPDHGIARAMFATRPGAFLVSLQNPPAEGSLTIFADEGATVAELAYGADDGLLVLPDGITIRNARETTTDYRLAVPAAVESVTVIIGADTIGTLRGDELRGGRVWRFSRRR